MPRVGSNPDRGLGLPAIPLEAPPLKLHVTPEDRFKDLLMAQTAALAEGAYNTHTHTRHVQAGADPRSATDRMVSLHELYHSYLNDTTGYGLCLIMAGALTNHDPGRYGNVLAVLMAGALKTHESFATAASIFGAAGGWFDETLLDGYPDYARYLNTWRSFLDAAPHPILAYQAIENTARAVMQTGLVEDLSRCAVKEWLEQAFTAAAPDQRLTSLLSPAFAKVLFRVTVDETLPGGPELTALLDGEMSHEAFRDAFRTGDLDPALDALGHAYYRLAQHRLRADNETCLDYNGHQEFTEALIEQTAAVVGDALRRSYRAPTQSENELDLIIGDFVQERLLLNEHPYPALLIPSTQVQEEKQAAMPVGPAEGGWVQLIALPAPKAAALYRFDPESAGELTKAPQLTAIRRRAVNDDATLSHIELFSLVAPDDLREISAHWGAIEAIVPIVSMTTLQDEAWRAVWLNVFEAFGDMPVLMDRNPFSWMEGLAERREDKVDVGRIRMAMEDTDPPQFFEIFCWRPRGSGFLLFTPCSAAVAGALAAQAKRWPETFIEDTGFIDAERTLLQRALSHVTREEHVAGFGWWK
ncbi:MAG: hypothetical protein AAGH68_12505 [Pseudomonadota bacterium]